MSKTMTVYIKRYPSKGELPKEEGRYIVSNGLTWFEVSYCKEYSSHEEFTDCSDVEVWLEEIEIIGNTHTQDGGQEG